jgi:hypothetical protein
MHAAYKKITATHRVIKLHILKTRKRAKSSSDKSSSTLITRVIERESDDKIDLITSKYNPNPIDKRDRSESDCWIVSVQIDLLLQ